MNWKILFYCQFVWSVLFYLISNNIQMQCANYFLAIVYLILWRTGDRMTEQFLEIPPQTENV